MSRIDFIKMHGCGNDFVVVDCMQGYGELPDFGALARRLCDRRFAVGADGLIAVLPHEEAHCRMRIFNADGSEAQMCGNGIRCVGRMMHERGYFSGKMLDVMTASGLRRLIVNVDAGGCFVSATVDMGAPAFTAPCLPASAPMIDANVVSDDLAVRLTAVSMGNPHGVVFVDDVACIPLESVGQRLENDPIWPEKANIEFASVGEGGRIAMRTWERGVGETLACGTGACAVAAAAVATGRAALPVQIDLAGGSPASDADGHILMTGPADTVFFGTVEC